MKLSTFNSYKIEHSSIPNAFNGVPEEFKPYLPCGLVIQAMLDKLPVPYLFRAFNTVCSLVYTEEQIARAIEPLAEELATTPALYFRHMWTALKPPTLPLIKVSQLDDSRYCMCLVGRWLLETASRPSDALQVFTFLMLTRGIADVLKPYIEFDLEVEGN